MQHSLNGTYGVPEWPPLLELLKLPKKDMTSRENILLLEKFKSKFN